MALTTSEETIRWSAREGVVPLIFLPFPDMALKGAQFYTGEANKAGRSLRLGQKYRDGSPSPVRSAMCAGR